MIATLFDGATLASAPLSTLFLSFLLYGFIGWLWESTVCAMLNHGHFSNSGFLLGPCCPIYGVGGLACWLLLRGVNGLFAQFAAAAVVCCTIEYAVGVLLERVTNARFWDYSNLPLNIHGRVCLYGALMFGTGAVCICRVMQPLIMRLLATLPAPVVIAAALVLACVVAVDAMGSLASWRSLSNQLEQVRDDLAQRIDENLQEASDSMLEKVPTATVDSFNLTHVRGRAINAWLAEITDAMMEALREKVAMPQFVADGTRGLRMAARRVRDAAPSVRSVATGARGVASSARQAALRPVPKIRFSRRELRFFNAFPHLRLNRYEGVIRATNLRDRARGLFRK